MIDEAKRGQRKVTVKEVTLICSLHPSNFSLLTSISYQKSISGTTASKLRTAFHRKPDLLVNLHRIHMSAFLY
jgi:hypothetical protein